MTDEKADPIAGILGAVFVRRLRLRHGGLSKVATVVGMSRKALWSYEKGKRTPAPEILARLGEKAGISRGQLELLRRLLDAQRLAEAWGLAGERAAAPGEPLTAEIAEAVLMAIEEAGAFLTPEPAPEPWEDTGRPRPEDRSRADVLWQRLRRLDPKQRSRLVRESAAFRIWSLVERLCNESKVAAADAPADALELARLALEVARKIRGTASWRARVEALLALPHLGNALRVCNDLAPARAAFDRTRKLRDAFSPSDPPLLDEGRLPDLEASLCREERRFPEAVALHDEAFRLSPLERRGSILLNKAFTLEQMGDFERALATLKEAEPYVLASGAPRDLCVLRFNTAVCLCNLGRAGQAEELVSEVQRLADQLGALARLRTRWLTARVAAGLGRTEEAIAILDGVCNDFLRCKPPLPYDAALAGLDLALYWLKQGDTGAVKKLAVPLQRVFSAIGIRREAVRSLRLFCEAARREAATVELAQKAKADVERAARSR
ncbi:MAG TPA: helix-turn-helix transcriptional regulator [Thermoanaerobaculia bacterium]|nr:helix-turn-helix transcriptional regulator [Thermoanaerobaculia bacterium]